MQHTLWMRCRALWAAALWLAFAPMAHAQPPASALIHHPDAESVDWRQANDAVGQFLRGHIDLLRWEQEHLPPVLTPPAAPDEPITLAQALSWARQAQPHLVGRANATALERAHLQRQTQAMALALEQAWVQAVVAQQSLRYQYDVVQATEAGAELARRMAQVGNWSRAQYLQQDLLFQQAQADYALAQHQAHSATLALWQMLHQPRLSPQDLALRLPHNLPELPRWPAPQEASPATPPTHATSALLAMAKAHHPDWPSLHAQAQQAQRSLSAAHKAQLHNTLAQLSQTDLALGPALWPRHQAMPHSVEQTLLTLARHAELERSMTAHVERAWHRWTTAQDLADTTLAQVQQHHVELEEAAVQQYNGMFMTTWDLLARTRQRIDAVRATLQAQQQAWMAHIALRSVTAGLPDMGGDLSANAPSTAAAAKPH
jgi:hypothetical protein